MNVNGDVGCFVDIGLFVLFDSFVGYSGFLVGVLVGLDWVVE